MKPMYALHKDANGSILTAASFSYDFELGKFVREADIRPGDSIHFGEALKRESEVEPLPAFLSEEVTPEPEPEPEAHPDAVLVAEQPF